MPIFFQQEVDNETRLAVWQIAEPEAFFDVPPAREISHPHKRLQHLAGRYLLRSLFPDFPLELIRVADTRRPFLAGDPFHFSISHCGDFAAAIVSRSRRVGIDVELPDGKASRIRHKFIGEEEGVRLHAWAGSLPPEVADTLLWSVKEAAFKWYALGNVDFRKDMPLHGAQTEPAGQFRFDLRFEKETGAMLEVHGRLLPPICLAFVVGEKEHG